MRIVHVVEASFAGVGRHVLDLIDAQSAAGHEVSVVYSGVRESASFERERMTLDNASWHRCAMQRSPHPTDARAIRLVRRVAAHADVVHGHSTKGGLIARLGAPQHTRVVYTPNAVFSMNPFISGKVRRIVGSVERLLSRRTDVVVAVSPEEAEHLRSLGIASDKIHVVLNGTRSVVPCAGAEVRRQLGLPADPPVVGFIGRLDDQKAPLDLVGIFELALEVEADLHLAVVGEGPLRSDLEDLVAGSQRLSDRVSLLGEQPGTWAMAAFDVLALPSRYEGFPYVLIEAAAQGLRFVASEHCNAAELLRRGAAGAIVERRDRRAFAERLAKDAVARRPAHPVLVGVDEMAAGVFDLYRPRLETE